MELGIDLPHDLIVNILSRLPVKTLLRSRCVSKGWCKLISDTHFIHSHSVRSKQNRLLFLLTRTLSEMESSELSPLLLSSMDMDGKVISEFEVSLSNDSVLMFPTTFDLVCFIGDEIFHVCNPSTQEFITLPEPTHFRSFIGWNSGFGYVESTNEYKVVHLFDRNLSETDPPQMGCEVFTLGNGSTWTWRDVGDCPFQVCYRPAYVNGAVHWMIDNEFLDSILAFDLKDEKFRVLPRPEGITSEGKYPEDIFRTYVVEIGGLLSMTSVLGDKMDIWVLKDNKNHVWVKQYSIDMVAVDRYFGNDEHSVCFVPRGIQDGGIFIETGYGALAFYDLQSKSCRTHEIGDILNSKRIDNGEIQNFVFTFYVESLRPLGGRVMDR